jgi:hypothetical protein
MQIDKRSPLRVFVFVALPLFVAHAANADGFNTTISGFGSLGGTYTGNSNYAYVLNTSDFKATNSQFDLGLDSRIGVQATFTYGSDMSVVVQEEAKRRGSENFDPGTEWAYFQYTPTSDIKLRFGRVALATFLTSDSRDVGYAQPWFTAPNEVYAAEPFEYLDGGQVLWHVNLGPVGLDLEGAYGTTSQTLQVSGAPFDLDAKSVYNVAAALTYESFLVRVADTKASVPFTLPLGPTTTVSFMNQDKFLSAGFQYDDGKAIVLSEWAKRSEPNAPIVNLPLTIATQWYVAAGWRFGKWTPLVSEATYKTGLALLYSEATYTTPSASLRYDIVSNLALKAQISRPQAGNGLYWAAASTTSNERITVASFGVDFVF